jgi:hypothetical protein
LKQRIIAKKKAEMQDYTEDVEGVLSMYVPPDPQRMQQAFEAGKVPFNSAGGVVNLILADYAQAGRSNNAHFRYRREKDHSLRVNT